ncbi:MAG: hypothetical protein ACOC9W_02885 [Persicimonas sp.]
MAQSLFNKFNLSKESLTELQQDLLHKGADVRERSVRLRDELEERSTEVTGRLRDASLTKLYGVGATTLSRAAELADKVPSLRDSANELRQKAEAAQEASEAVQRPPIANYDELNVGEVSEALDGLSAYDLEKVRRYETAHKNRVTVLRDVEQRLN